MASRLVQPGSGQLSSAPFPVVFPNPLSAGTLAFIVAVQNTVGEASTSGLASAEGALQIGAGASRVTLLKGAGSPSLGPSLSIAMTGFPGSVYAAGAEFAGVSTTEDAPHATNSSGGVNTLNTGTVTTVSADCLLLAWIAAQTAVIAAATIDSGFTIVGSQLARVSLAYKFVNVAGAQSAAWSWTTSGPARAGMKAFPVTATGTGLLIAA